MRKLIIILGLIAGNFNLFAQQVGMNNHYFSRPFLYNPGYTGIHDNIELFVLRRDQWNSISHAPKINIFSLDGSLNNKKISLGVNVIDEQRGFNKRTGFNFNYAYHFDLNAETSISFGLAVGMTFHTVDFSNVVAQDYNDQTIFSGNQQTSSFNGNAGFVFKWKKFEFNCAVPQLLGNKVKFYDASTGTNTDYTLVRHFISNINYKFELSRENQLYLVPVVITRYIPKAPFQFDANLIVQWKNKGWVGAQYKSNYAVAANAGMTLFRRLDIGYSYEFISSNLKGYTGLSHEIMLKVKFGSVGEKLKNKEEDYVTNENGNEELTTDSIPTYETDVVNNTPIKNNNSTNNTNTQNNNTGNNNIVSENTVNTNSSNNKTQNNQTVNENNGNKTNNASTNNSGNTIENKNTHSTSTKYYENGILIMKEMVVNYRLSSKKQPAKGYYVIVGTYYYEDFAENEAKRIAKEDGYKTGVLHSDTREYNFIYVYNEKSLDKAIQKAKDVQEKGFKDAWVKILE